MTDLELIELLQQKSAGELTPTEIDAIRTRWTQSPELRQALVEHLQLESQLNAALGTVHLDVDTILKRASQQRKVQPAAPYPWRWLVGLTLLFACGAAWSVFRTPPKERIQVADNEPVSLPQIIEVPADAMHPVNHSERFANTGDDDPAHKESAETTANATSEPAPNPIPKPVVAEIAPNEPWSESLARDAVPQPANSPLLTTEYKSAGHDELPDSEARRWLAQVEGQPYSWSTDLIGNPARRIARFQGLAKLRAPWPNDAVLRLTPFEVSDLTLYFWRGSTGVALRFYTRREPHLWSAFEITRENSSPKPTRYGLLTTDSGSYTRSTPGMLDIRHQGNELVLARGGLVLLSVPFAGPPIEVFVEGQFRLRGLSMFRSAPFLDPPENSHPVLFSDTAAKVPWAISAEFPASFTPNDDGSVSMTADSRDKSGTIAFPFGWLLAMEQSLRATGLFEVIVNIDSAEPGTGIFLGDRDGRPLQQLGFFKDNATQQTTFGILRPGEMRTDANYNPVDFPPPYLAKSGWFKLTAGLGTLHVQTSGDGRKWGHVVESPGRDLPGAVASVGIFGLPGDKPRTIRVRHIEIKELNGITGIADTRLRSLVVPIGTESWRDSSTWSHKVLDTQPPGCRTDDWFIANAVATLSQGPPKDFGVNLLRQLIDVGLRLPRSFEQKRQLLDDACLLCDLFDDGLAKVLGAGYEELGWQLAEAGDDQSLAKTRTAWLRSPMWTSNKMRYVWERLHSHEILQSVYRRDWTKAWNSAMSAGYWNRFPHPDQKPADRGEELDRHARWAKAYVAEAVPQLDDGTAGVMPLNWRHPLVPVLNKEAYNVRAELQSALSGHNFEDACRIMMSVAEHDGPGLLPDPDDRQLYVSMRTAIANARRDYPGFAQTMTDKFEPLGQIRVQSALNRRDIAGLYAATLQFMGTDAARTANMSLGDIALSVGQFEQAEQLFRDALLDASPRWDETVGPRMQLARALGGRLSGDATVRIPTSSLDLNGTIVSPAEFQSIISDLAPRSANGTVLAESSPHKEVPFPQAMYKLEPRANFDGQPGNNPGRMEYRFGDPFGRQFSVDCDDQRMYINNRFQLNAYSVADGKQLWAQGLGSEQGEAYALPLTSFKPIVSGERLFVRRITKAGTELACLNVDDGHVVWHQRPFHGVLTDPIIWNGRLFAVTLARIDDETVQAEASWFDQASGNVSNSRPLFRLRDANDRQFSGQVAVSDRVAVCTVAGTAVCFDSRGEMRWLRRFTYLQKPVDELAEDMRPTPPIIQTGKVIVSIPGVREVNCLDIDTGSLLWERPISNVRGLLFANGSSVLVDTTTGLSVLNSESGEMVWNRQISSRLEGWNVHGQVLTVARRASVSNNRSRPILMWLELATGEELGQTLIDVGDREEFQLGPMFSAAGKWWSLVGSSWKDPKRELQEFVMIPGVVPRPYVDESRAAWTPALSNAQLAEVQTVVPGWFPVANYRERLSLHAGELQGEAMTLVSKVGQHHSSRFTTCLNLAAGRKLTLRLRVGNQPGQKWKLELRHENRLLLEQDIEDATGVNGWHNVNVDLTTFAGQSLPLQLIQTPLNGVAAEALLKRIELAVE